MDDIWPEWADLSRRLAYQVEGTPRPSAELLASMEPERAAFTLARWIAVHERLAAEARGERFPGVFLRDLA